jgi:plasmid maintenance system antidote protein VapI
MRGGENLLAQNINEYLKNKGIKQTWLAEQVGIPTTTLNGIINGKVQMKADLFIRICQVLNVPPETFSEKQETV